MRIIAALFALALLHRARAPAAVSRRAPMPP